MEKGRGETKMRAGIEKGMILAAGLGTRLHPITHKCPKPLVPVLNVPNILYSIDLLARAGAKDIVINVHHLRKSLVDFLGDGSRWGVRISFSEEEVLLGTGGGVKKAESHFEGKPFLLTNSDFITNADLSPFVSQHFERRSLASMLLIEDPALESYYSKVGTDSASRLCSLPSLTTRPSTRSGIFTGVHLIDSTTLDHLEAKPSGINQVLYPALMRETPDRVFGSFLERSFWLDTGDLHFLWDTSLRLLKRLESGEAWLREVLVKYGELKEIRPGIWCARGQAPEEGIQIKGPVILGANLKLERGCRVGPYTVVGDGSIVGTGSSVESSVLLPGSRLGANVRLEKGLWFESQTLSTQRSHSG
jgi:NDP-sugar pyrophosphorylase family protein